MAWLARPTLLQKLLLHAPLGLAVCVVGLMALITLAWPYGWWRRMERWRYTGLVMATLDEIKLMAD